MNLPKNWVENIDFEQYMEPWDYRNSVQPPLFGSSDAPYKYDSLINQRVRAKITIVVEMNTEEEKMFVNGLRNEGLKFVSDNGFQLEKFRSVINQGYQRLPMLMKHQDQDIQNFAWILSKYYSKRDEIMPKDVM